MKNPNTTILLIGIISVCSMCLHFITDHTIDTQRQQIQKLENITRVQSEALRILIELSRHDPYQTIAAK